MVLLRKKVQILQSALTVLPDGRPKQAAQNVSLARQGVSATSKVQPVKVVTSDSIVKVKRKMPMVLLRKKVQIQRHALIVRQVGHQKKVVQNVKRVVLGRTVRVVYRAN